MQEKNTDTKLIISIIIVFIVVAGIIAFAMTRPAAVPPTNEAPAATTDTQSVPQTTIKTTNPNPVKTMEPQTAAEKGKAFLADNATKPGVVVLPSGLQYKVITEGTGPKPERTQTVKVNYEGTLIDGTIFDSSYKRGEPIEFGVTQVIDGWIEGLQLMSVGSTYMFYIPSNLAYGIQGMPPGGIGPNETLIFKVELLGVRN
jgi:FKBP-type peptidyl-prolyl cis-trans isomerase